MTNTVTVFYKIILANSETYDFLHIQIMYKDSNLSKFKQLGVSCKIINMSTRMKTETQNLWSEKPS